MPAQGWYRMFHPLLLVGSGPHQKENLAERRSSWTMASRTGKLPSELFEKLKLQDLPYPRQVETGAVWLRETPPWSTEFFASKHRRTLGDVQVCVVAKVRARISETSSFT